MQKKISSFINSSIAMSAAFVLLGIVFICFPQGSLDVIRWIIAIFFMIIGVFMLSSDLTGNKLPFFGNTALGTILLIVGILFAANSSVMDIFPIVLGAWFIVSSVSSLRFSAALGASAAGVWAMFASIISILCGIILILNPWGGQIAMMTFAGIMMIIYAVASLVDLITLKRNFDNLTDKFNKLIEGEVVEKSPKTEKKSAKK